MKKTNIPPPLFKKNGERGGFVIQEHNTANICIYFHITHRFDRELRHVKIVL